MRQSGLLLDDNRDVSEACVEIDPRAVTFKGGVHGLTSTPVNI